MSSSCKRKPVILELLIKTIIYTDSSKCGSTEKYDKFSIFIKYYLP